MVISLDFSEVAHCPRNTWLSVAHAWTMWIGKRPAARLNNPRKVFPSMVLALSERWSSALSRMLVVNDVAIDRVTLAA